VAVSDRYTLQQLEVLRSLRMSGHEWHRPMDIGARNGSHHHGTLSALIRKGAVIRRCRGGLMANLTGTFDGPLGQTVRAGRGSYVYALTDKGRADAPTTWKDLTDA
jgi:hypothetical protein